MCSESEKMSVRKDARTYVTIIYMTRTGKFLHFCPEYIYKCEQNIIFATYFINKLLR